MHLARINIEDSLHTDNRFLNLCFKLGSRRMALGAIMEAWILAQRFHSIENPRALIDRSEWLKQEIGDEIIETGLASIEDEKIYLKGAENQFNWLLIAKLKGKSGGLAKASSANSKASSANSKASSAYPLPLPLSFKKENTNTSEAPRQVSDPVAEHFALGLLTERTVRERLISKFPNKRGWSRAWPAIRKALVSASDKNAELDKMELSVINFAADMKRQRREENKITQFGNFFEKGDWKDYVEIPESVNKALGSEVVSLIYKPDWNEPMKGPEKSPREMFEEALKKTAKKEESK